MANSPSLSATVSSDRAVTLTISNHSESWWFKIENWGTCTAASGTTVSNIRGYKAGTYSVWAYSDSNCGTQIASTSFTITNATLSTTVNTDRSVDLTLSGGPSNWWFRIESWGGCTAASGTGFSNIRGYQTGTYQVVAFTDSNCSFHLATSAFTIPSATLAASVNSSRAVSLTLTGGPSSWWFRINGGTCTGASGATFSNIRGYAPGSYYAEAFSNSGCNYKITTTTFTIADYAAAPASVVGYRGWQLIDVEWSAVTGATGYDVNYWHAWYGTKRAHSNISGGSETTKKARITLPANSNVGDYHVSVRAIDANGPGLWKESAAIPSITIVPKASNVTAARKTNDNTTINVSWTICDVNATSCNGGTPVTGQLVNLSDDGGATWERVKTLTSYTSGSNVAIASSEVTGGITGDKSYIVEVGIQTRFKTTWVRAAAPVPHVYQTVSNIANTATWPNYVSSTKRWAASFTTGSHPAGYTLQSVVTPLKAALGSDGVVWKIHTATTAENPTPTDTVQVTLTNGGNPTDTSAYSNFTHTCSGSGCNLEPDTTYFLVATSPTSGSSTYHWAYTSPIGIYTANPSGNGWSIGLGWYSNYSSNTWGNWQTWGNDVGKMEVQFKPKPTDLPASRGVSGYRGWGFIDAEWSPVTNATSYYVRYRAAQGNHWMTRAKRHTGTSIRLGGIPNYWDYIIQVQAINSSGGGAWAESAPVKPVRALQTAASNVAVTRSDGAIAVSWTQCDITQFSCNGGTPITGWAISISSDGGAWTRAKDLTTYTSGSAITIDSGIDNTKSYQVHVGVITRFKTVWTNATVPDEILTVEDLTHNSATLKIINHSGDWYYKALAGPDATCQGPVSGSTDSLTGLSTGTTYTYTAYSDSACTDANKLAGPHWFVTLGALQHVTNLTSTESGDTNIHTNASIDHKAAMAFTTGPNSAGYRLSSFTASLREKESASGDLVMTLQPMEGSGSYSYTSEPSTTILATLSGSSPSSSSWQDLTYTCAGTGCDLAANTTYFAVGSYTGSGKYAWAYTSTNVETTHPANNGWDLEYGHLVTTAGTWSSWTDWHVFRADFRAIPTPSLSATNITQATATLSIANYGGAWWYQRTAPSGDNTCHSVAAGTTTASLSALTAGTSYTYKAYSDACTTEIASHTFTTN